MFGVIHSSEATVCIVVYVIIKEKYMPFISTRGTATFQGFSKIGISTPAVPPDPQFSVVRLLAHMNGTNGATTFVDSSGRSTLGNPFSAASLSNVDPKFGSTCLNVIGESTATCDLPSAIGSSDFTIEFWVKRLAGGPATQVIYDMRGAGAGAASQLAPCIYYSGTNFVYFTGGVDRITGGVGALDVWTSIALTRTAGITRMYVNGSLVGQYSDTNIYINSRAIIGGTAVVGNASMSGYMDEIRITLAARYTGATYPVQIAEFPNF